jgi:ssDNA-binding Zn-finger/Zn-ribbon topoisomerase 1
MSFVGSLSTGGIGSVGRFAGITRGRIQGSPTNGVNYPSPFFDVAHTYLPVTVKQLFKWCRYYFLTNPLVNATVFKMSEYPVTDIIIEHEDTKVRKRWEEYYHDHLRFRSFQIECGLDYYTYGTAPISLGFPFKKFLTCPVCKFQARADKIRKQWTFTSLAFRLNCPSCGNTSEAEARDVYYKNASGIVPLRWNVENIEINYNEVTGETTHFYTIPPVIRNDITIGKKDVVESVPQVFIQAIRQRKGIVFSKDNFFAMKRPTLAQQDRGWGTPLVLPVLKDTFYLQIMKKAQEAILLEHIIPLRVLFPQAGSGTSDPYTTINLNEWREQVAAEIARWRYDNNYIPILPLPIGHQSIGGDGRALLLTQEIQIWSEQIMVGMGVPKEFLLGGMSYSGTNVSMRMLENAFLGYIQRQKEMANWFMQRVAAYMGWPRATVKFKPFKMADDMQRKAYLFQLNQSQKISDTTLLHDSDLRQEDEDALMVAETASRFEATKKQQLAMAKIQGEAQEIMMKSQVKAQQIQQAAMMAPNAPGEPGGPEGAMMGGGVPQEAQSPLNAGQDAGIAPKEGQQPQQGMDITQLAMMLAEQYVELPPDQQQMAMQNLQAQSPELAQLVEEYANQLQAQQPQGMGGALGAAVSQVDMRAMPEQKPPRREAALV